MTAVQVLLTIGVASVITFAIRALPFACFGGSRKIPPSILRLGALLPRAVMASLLVYCFKLVDFSLPGTWMPDAIALVVVVLLHLWKRNVLLSVAVGTVVCMLLRQGM